MEKQRDVPLRILFSAYTVDPESGGEPQMAWNWIHGATLKGHEVVVITDELSSIRIKEKVRELKIKNIAIHSLSGRKIPKWVPFEVRVYLRYFIWQFEINKFAKKNQLLEFDVAHHTSWGNIALGSGLASTSIPFVFGPAGGGLFGNPKLIDFYGKDWKYERIRNYLLDNAFFSWYGQKSCKKASIILATNKATLDLATKLGSNNVVQMLADAIPEQQISLNVIRPRKKNVIFVGRFLPRKGVNLAIFAFAEVLNMIPDAKLILVGYGPKIDELKELVLKLGIQKSVSFEGRLSWAATQKKIKEAQVFLFSSLRDSFGAQVLEAAAKGIPVVSLSNGGASEWIGKPGLLQVKIGTVRHTIEEMAKNIAQILLMSDEEWKLASDFQLGFARLHTVEKKVAEMNELYLQIYNKRNELQK